MPSPFARAFAAARLRPGSLDAQMGESVEVHPFAAGELSRGVASGAPYLARAIVDMPEEAVRAAGLAEAGKSEIVLTQPQAEFALTQFGEGRPRIAAGFEVVLLDRPGAPRWRVKGDPRDDGVSALVAILERMA